MCGISDKLEPRPRDFGLKAQPYCVACHESRRRAYRCASLDAAPHKRRKDTWRRDYWHQRRRAPTKICFTPSTCRVLGEILCEAVPKVPEGCHKWLLALLAPRRSAHMKYYTPSSVLLTTTTRGDRSSSLPLSNKRRHWISRVNAAYNLPTCNACPTKRCLTERIISSYS